MLKSCPTHTDNFKNFDEGLASVFGRDVLDQWLQEIKTWEADFSQPCPYEAASATQMTITEIRIELEKEEQAALAKCPKAIVQESNASAMLALGLEIEDLQSVFQCSAMAMSNDHFTDDPWHGK